MATKLSKTEIVKLAYESETKSDLRKLTVQQLRTAVREATKDVNERAKYRTSAQAEVSLNKLKAAGLEVINQGDAEAIKKQLGRVKVSANVNYKSKEQLIEQYKALRKYQKADTESEQAIQEYEKGFEDAFEKFRKSDKGSNYTEITSEDFKNIVNKLDTYEGAISKKEFKYEIFQAINQYKKENKNGDVKNALDNIIDAISGSATEDDAINNMYISIGLTR